MFQHYSYVSMLAEVCHTRCSPSVVTVTITPIFSGISTITTCLSSLSVYAKLSVTIPLGLMSF